MENNSYIDNLRKSHDDYLDYYNYALKEPEEENRQWHAYYYGMRLAMVNQELYLREKYNKDIYDYVKDLRDKIGNLLMTEWSPLKESRNYNPSKKAKKTITITINNCSYFPYAENFVRLSTFYVPGGYYVDFENRNTEFIGDDGKIKFCRHHFNDPDKYFNKDIASKIKEILSEFYTLPCQRDWMCLEKKYEFYNKNRNLSTNGIEFFENEAVNKWIY